MRRLICALAVLMLVSSPAQASFKGTLRGDTPWSVEIITGENGGNTAVTVYYLGRTLDIEAIFSVPPGVSFEQDLLKPGGRVRRIIVEVDMPTGGAALVKVTQGIFVHEDGIQNTEPGGTSRIVFDVV